VRGIYINLDSCTDRRYATEQALLTSGFNSGDYLRLSGRTPVGNEPQLTLGLKSSGELGVWLSFLDAFETAQSEAFSPFVHFMEDDVALTPGFKRVVDQLMLNMDRSLELKDVDIIFFDYFITMPLFKSYFAVNKPLAPINNLRFLPAGKYYVACTSSFLVRRGSLKYIHEILFRILRDSRALLPVDLTLRNLLKQGLLNAALLIPPICAPSWDNSELSTIQDRTPSPSRISRQAHKLLRVWAASVESRTCCIDRLRSLLSSDLQSTTDSELETFLAIWESESHRFRNF